MIARCRPRADELPAGGDISRAGQRCQQRCQCGRSAVYGRFAFTCVVSRKSACGRTCQRRWNGHKSSCGIWRDCRRACPHPRQIKLGMFLRPAAHHVAGWRHQDAWADGGLNFATYVEMAQTAEARPVRPDVLGRRAHRRALRPRDAVAHVLRGVDRADVAAHRAGAGDAATSASSAPRPRPTTSPITSRAASPRST